MKRDVFMQKVIAALLCLVLIGSLCGCNDTRTATPQEQPVSNDAQSSVDKALCSVMAVFCDINAPTGATVATSDGSAVIIRISGDRAYLVTNYHVIYNELSGEDGALCDAITLAPYGAEDGDGYAAECLWYSKDYDLALLRISDFSSTFPAARAAEADVLREIGAGDPILAIGNWLGLGIAVHRGCIGRPYEEITLPVSYSDLDLTLRLTRFEAVMNKGDSGGALFSDDGKLLGIINARRTDGTVGYAIPISTVFPIIDQVISACERGEEPRAYSLRMGISVEEKIIKTEYDADTQKITTHRELLITSSEVGSVGSVFLQADDVLLGVSRNGGAERPLNTERQLEEFLSSCASGDTLVWRYRRGDSEQTYSLIVTPLQMQEIK